MQEYKWDGKIYEYGSAILKQKTELVINDKQLRLNLVEILKSALYLNSKMQGLALPQLGIPLKGIMCISNGKQMFMFNPIITKQSKIIRVSNESCLSVKGRYYVKRTEYINVVYEDIEGRIQIIKETYPHSRIICHEIDHLNGICLPDIGSPTDK